MVSHSGKPARCQALMIAAPASGSGKTTITAALAAWHRAEGRRVKVFKCGPDFIDPMWLADASGQPVDNLDLWLVGEQPCRHLLHRAALDNEVILVEAVMGLFDGTPSAADLAQRFGLPLALVIDASAMAQTFGALAHGLMHYRPGLTVSAVIANKVAGSGHAAMLAESLPAGLAFAAVERGEAFGERHLGLQLPAEQAQRSAILADVAGQLSRHAPRDWTREVAFEPADLPAVPPRLAGKRIAVAQDAAFCFIYPANLACLEQLGAELIPFSPLAHEPLPEADAVWLPGGYPELHAERLASHPTLPAALAAHHAAGKAILAECGGMLVLGATLDTLDGHRHTLWGLLPGAARMQNRLGGLGLQSLDLGAGVLHCHTFHYSRFESPLTPASHGQARRHGSQGEAVWRHGSLTASYLHAWFSSNPLATAALFGVCP